MASPSYRAELLAELARLPVAEQRRVLEFARALRRSQLAGAPADRVRELAVGITADDLRSMEQAIAEGCERVDANEW
jgi:hypothetical protein